MIRFPCARGTRRACSREKILFSRQKSPRRRATPIWWSSAWGWRIFSRSSCVRNTRATASFPKLDLLFPACPRQRHPADLAREIEIFENEIALRKQGKIDEKVFAETRLRRGAYGQRYDNGQRNDGLKTQTLSYPSGELTKGPTTLWDAPGMQRIK